jgi:hypothetical protein
VNEIFIPGSVPSLKNSKVKTARGIFHSKTVTNYLREHGIKSYSTLRKTVEGYARKPNTFKPHAMQLKKMLEGLDPPYCIEFYFIRKTKTRFDFGNGVELISDLFTAHDVWDDDNCDVFLPFPRLINGSCYHVDKGNPGVIIRVKPN